MAKNEVKSFINEVATRNDAYGDYNNFIKWLPNPDIVLAKANKTIAVYKELLADPFVHGCMESRKSGVLSLEWDIDRGKAKSRQTQFVKTIFANLKIYDIISSVLDAVGYGYSVMEIIWSMIDGYWVPTDIKQKPADWFCFDPDGRLLFKSKMYPMGEPVPDNKFLVATNNGSYVNPYGMSILSKCFWATTFKKGGLKFWVTFTEKFGNPWTLIKVPSAFNQNQIDEVVEAFDKMVQEGIAVYKENIDAALQFPSSASVDIFERMLQYCKDDISMAFLGHTKASQSVPGELGNKKAQLDVREDIVLSDKRIVEGFFNELIKIIFKLNFDSSIELPTFILYEEQDEIDINLANRDMILKNMGVNFTKDYIKRAYYLGDSDFEISAVAPSAEPAPKQEIGIINQTDINKSNEFADVTKPGQAIIDAVADKIIKESKKLIEGLSKPIIDYINKSGSFEEALDGLAQLYPKLNTDELYDKLVSLQFAAELVGRFEVRDELGLKK